MVAGFEVAGIRRSHRRHLYHPESGFRRILRARWRIHRRAEIWFLCGRFLFQCPNARHRQAMAIGIRKHFIGHILTTIEIIVGMFGLAVMTG